MGSPNAIVFADRPVRAAGHDTTAHIVEDWDKGNDNFGKDPPNATVSGFTKDGSGVKDVVVVLKSPNLEGDKLTFDVDVLEGDLSGADGAAVVFIDLIGRPFTPMSFAGVARRSAYRGAYYAGAARRRSAYPRARSPVNMWARAGTSDSASASAQTFSSGAQGALSLYSRSHWRARLPSTSPSASPRSNCGPCLKRSCLKTRSMSALGQKRTIFDVRFRIKLPPLYPRKQTFGIANTMSAKAISGPHCA